MTPKKGGIFNVKVTRPVSVAQAGDILLVLGRFGATDEN